MFRTRFKVSRVAFLIFLSLLARESGAVEFNTDVVDAEDKGNIDFTAFSRAGYVMPGSYQMQVSLNGDSVGNEISVPFYVRSSSGEKEPLPEACLPLSLVDKLGLKEASRQKVGAWHQGQCADFRGLPGVQITPDLSRSRVNLNIPQAWLEYSDASWLPPSRWDNGIPGVLLDYNASGMVTKNQGQSQQQYASVNGTAGLNAGAWRLRADYQGNYSHITGSRQPTQQRFDLSRMYLYRPLPQMQAKLTLGENYVNSSLFDSWRYTGGGWKAMKTCCRRSCVAMRRKLSGWQKPTPG